MEKMEHTPAASLLYLADCALHRQAPDARALGDMDFEELLRLSKFHAMASVTCMALEAGGLLKAPYMDAALAKQWTDEKNRAIRKDMLLDDARCRIFAWMDSRGIWYMPLKGSVLKELYPRMGMRQMADNDILFDAAFQSRVRDYMVSQGYTAIAGGASNHDAYQKPPIYNFEFHTSLFSDAAHEAWFRYYAQVKDRLLKDADHSCGYHFRDEDFYLYMMAHMRKHYNNKGTGLRSFMDCYVYLNAKEQSLDWAYIHREADKLGLSAFEADCRALSKKLFCDPTLFYSLNLTDRESDMISFSTGSGAYGTRQNRIGRDMRELQSGSAAITSQTRKRYLLRRLFPNRAWFRRSHPFLYRHPVFIPLFDVYRIARGVLLRGKAIRGEVNVVNRVDHDRN